MKNQIIEFVMSTYLWTWALVIAICFIAAIVIGEVQMVKKQKKKWAAMIILAAFLLGTGSAVYFSVITQGWGINQVAVYDGARKGTNAVAFFDVIKNPYEHVLGFGKLKVLEKGGFNYIDLVFDKNHKLVGSPEAMKFKKSIEATLKDRKELESITGISSEIEELKILSYKNERKYFDKEMFFTNIVIFNFITGILIIIYVMGWLYHRRRRINSVDSARIQDL